MIMYIGIGVGVLLFLIIIILIGRKRGKKKKKSLADTISKINEEKAKWTEKEEKFNKEKKEKDAFAHIEITDDIEEELGISIPEPYKPPEKEEVFEEERTGEEVPDLDEFLKMRRPQERRIKIPPTIKEKTREDEFEDFLDEHAYSRRVFDKNLRTSLNELPPKIKAIILGNLFDKYDD